jgi:hypothetical protein
MNLVNCSNCGRMFTRSLSSNEFCPACLKQSEENYRKISEYFVSHPTSTSQEISDATGIDLKDIHRFVRENRLRTVKNDTGRNCEKCGGPIFGGKLSGKFCDKCRIQLATDMRKDMQKNLKSGSPENSQPKTSHLAHSKPIGDSKKPKKH